jgi:hypothetical protein
VLLDGGGLEAKLCGDGRHGAGVVGLDAADGDEGVGALGLGLSSEVPVGWKLAIEDELLGEEFVTHSSFRTLFPP